MNKQQQKLKLQMILFTIFIFVAFGLIIINEKSSLFLLPKVENKINDYINTNYNDIKNDINKSKVTYKNNKYTMIITNKNNKHLYFYIYYKNKKINDTYKKDYVEGNSILKYEANKIEKDINKKNR